MTRTFLDVLNIGLLVFCTVRCSEIVQQLYALLLQLYGFERDAARLGPIRQAMAELASACGKSAFEDLAEIHGPAVMEEACSGADK